MELFDDTRPIPTPVHIPVGSPPEVARFVWLLYTALRDRTTGAIRAIDYEERAAQEGAGRVRMPSTPAGTEDVFLRDEVERLLRVVYVRGGSDTSSWNNWIAQRTPVKGHVPLEVLTKRQIKHVNTKYDRLLLAALDDRQWRIG